MATTASDHKEEKKNVVSSFRNVITADGSSGFKAEAKRYHLYVAAGCPFCSRVQIAINLKGLSEVIDISYVAPVSPISPDNKNGWLFTEGKFVDPLFNKKSIIEIYKLGSKVYEGRYTVPLLWDKKTNEIVNNESPDMLKFFASEFDSVAKNPKLNLRPTNLVQKIDEINEVLQNGLNMGVYRAGFATTQSAYDEAVIKVFSNLRLFRKHFIKKSIFSWRNVH